MASAGLVIPVYRPALTQLTDYVRALDDQLGPETIRIELDDADREVANTLSDSDLPRSVNVNSAPYRRGKGAAITAGFEALDTDILAFIDADGSTPVDSVREILAPLRNDDRKESADLTVGSRRHPNAIVTRHQTHVRRRLGDAFALIARRLLDIDLYDFQCGAKALTTETWAAIRQYLYEPGFAWDIELVTVTAALDHTIEEVPIRWEDKDGSTVSPVRTPLAMGKGLLTAHHRARSLQNSRLHRVLDRDDESALIHREPRL
jgi:glycosyltransferase involved in cell wall biosynthesis